MASRVKVNPLTGKPQATKPLPDPSKPQETCQNLCQAFCSGYAEAPLGTIRHNAVPYPSHALTHSLAHSLPGW